MRFLRKRVAFVGGVLSAFIFAVGAIAAVTAIKGNASAAQNGAQVKVGDQILSGSGKYITNVFRLKVDGADGELGSANGKRAWCGGAKSISLGDGSTPGYDNYGTAGWQNYSYETITVTNDSPVVEQNIFKTMYYGEEGGYSDYVIHSVLTFFRRYTPSTSVGYSGLTKKVIESPLPDVNDMKIYHSVGRSNYEQNIYSYDYEEKPQTQDLTVQKIWRDGLEPNKHTNIEIRFNIVKKGTSTMVATGTLSNSNGWRMEFHDLEAGAEYDIVELYAESGFTNTTVGNNQTYIVHDALKDENGDPIYYITPNATTQVCTHSDDGLSASCIMYNEKAEYENFNLWTYKNWIDYGSDDYRPDNVYYEVRAFTKDGQGLYTDITASLPRLINPATNEYYIFSKAKVPGMYVWGGAYVSDLPKYDAQNNTIYYGVRELNIPDRYTVSCADDHIFANNTVYCMASERADGDLEVEWTNTVKYTDFGIVKTWSDGEDFLNNRPSRILIDLYANDTYVNTYYLDEEDATAEDSNKWHLDLRLPVYDANNNEIVYSYSEADSYNRTTERFLFEDYVTLEEKIIENNSETGIINRSTIDIPVIKCWVDDDESTRPEKMIFDLLRDGEKIDEIVLTKENVNENGCWVGKKENLQAFEGTEKIVYTVEENAESVEKISYESDIKQCVVDIEERKANAAEGEEIDTSCQFNNRYVETPDTADKSLNIFYFAVPAAVLAGAFVSRRAFARR